MDYYTRLGLLKAERSSSNYCYYDDSSIERIHFIEKRKAVGMTLDEIKKRLSKNSLKKLMYLKSV
ncbi:MerR family transcriptional regulator [Robertmurraya sp. DFI.2.37]|nr:MerR family transcriptional regulator [Robertmurraya sp. DFI.2.37]